MKNTPRTLGVKGIIINNDISPLLPVASIDLSFLSFFCFSYPTSPILVHLNIVFLDPVQTLLQS
jgi:hypothetical protein